MADALHPLQLDPIEFTDKSRLHYTRKLKVNGTEKEQIAIWTEFHHSTAAPTRKALVDFFDTKTKAEDGKFEWWGIIPAYKFSRMMTGKQDYNDSVVIMPDKEGDDLTAVFDDDDEGLYGHYVANGANFHLDTKTGKVSIQILAKHYVDDTTRGDGKYSAVAVANGLRSTGKDEVPKITLNEGETKDFLERYTKLMGISRKTEIDGPGLDPDQNIDVSGAFMTFAGNYVKTLRYLRDHSSDKDVSAKHQKAIDDFTALFQQHFSYADLKLVLHPPNSSGTTGMPANSVEEYLELHRTDITKIKSSGTPEQKIAALDKVFEPLRIKPGLIDEDGKAQYLQDYAAAYKKELGAILGESVELPDLTKYVGNGESIKAFSTADIKILIQELKLTSEKAAAPGKDSASPLPVLTLTDKLNKLDPKKLEPIPEDVVKLVIKAVSEKAASIDPIIQGSDSNKAALISEIIKNGSEAEALKRNMKLEQVITAVLNELPRTK